MSDYRAEICVNSHRLLVRFCGEISTPHYSDFRHDYNTICRHIMEVGAPQMILDLEQTTFFGSLFVGTMLKLSMRIRAAGGRMVICGLSEQLMQLMRQLLLLERHAGEGSCLQHAACLTDAERALTEPASHSLQSHSA
ncbi:MAG: STAS domain-containing protein [Planctomycetaceae bacterium]|nr:STAS domain-containing protein [Planctomycetaceae bacterium]